MHAADSIFLQTSYDSSSAQREAALLHISEFKSKAQDLSAKVATEVKDKVHALITAGALDKPGATQLVTAKLAVTRETLAGLTLPIQIKIEEGRIAILQTEQHLPHVKTDEVIAVIAKLVGEELKEDLSARDPSLEMKPEILVSKGSVSVSTTWTRTDKPADENSTGRVVKAREQVLLQEYRATPVGQAELLAIHQADIRKAAKAWAEANFSTVVEPVVLKLAKALGAQPTCTNVAELLNIKISPLDETWKAAAGEDFKWSRSVDTSSNEVKESDSPMAVELALARALQQPIDSKLSQLGLSRILPTIKSYKFEASSDWWRNPVANVSFFVDVAPGRAPTLPRTITPLPAKAEVKAEATLEAPAAAPAAELNV